MIPLLVTGGALVFRNLSPVMAGLNSTVSLAREIRTEKQTGVAAVSEAAKAFKEAGKTEEELWTEEKTVLDRYRKGSTWMGVFLGLSLGAGFVSLTTRKRRTEYVPP